MALENTLANIPGLAGYLGMQEFRQKQALGGLQGAMGVLNALRQAEATQQAAQMHPVQMEQMRQQQMLMQTQGQSAQHRLGQEQDAQALLGQLYGQYQSSMQPKTVRDDIAGTDTTEPGMPEPQAQQALFTGMLQNPLIANTGMQGLTRLDAVESRREATQQGYLLRAQQLQQQREESIRRAQSDAERLQAQREYQQGMLALQRDSLELRRSVASNRPEPQAQIVQTENGPMLVDRAGGARPILGPDGAPVKARTSDKPLTEFQGKAVLYGTRTAQSDKILRQLEDNISTAGLAVKQSAQGLPIVGGVLGAAGNVMLSSEQQRVEQAQRDFVNAVLRQESGAVISEAEFANAKKQYFPQPGDSEAVKNQKRRNREIAINGFRRMAGHGSSDIDEIRNAPLIPSAQEPPKPARTQDIDALLRKYGG